MINSEQEELVEGVKYLQAFSPNYDPSKKALQSIIRQVKERFNSEKLSEIINTTDEKVPEIYNHYKIPPKRKEVIS